VKFLFDQNLAPRLAGDLADIFPESAHVQDLGMTRASDREIWDHAKEAGFVVVSKDNDFPQMNFVFRRPSEGHLIRGGNCSVEETGRIPRSTRLECMSSRVTRWQPT
jgi:predicted nuclease of predicted toxin-antitoxin system